MDATHELLSLLHRRLAIIADHSWRDRDGEAHLQALKSISEEIAIWTTLHRDSLDAKMRHFLSNCSYQKALDYLESGEADH